MATTSVSSSRPACDRSSIRAEKPWSNGGQSQVFSRPALSGCVIPARVARGEIPRLARKIHLHQPHTGFDQPPAQEQALAELVPAVAVAQRLALAFRSNTARVSLLSSRAKASRRCPSKRATSPSSARALRRRSNWTKAQPGQRSGRPKRPGKAQHLDPEVFRRRITDEQMRVPILTQETARLSWPGDARVVDHPLPESSPPRAGKTSLGRSLPSTPVSARASRSDRVQLPGWPADAADQ